MCRAVPSARIFLSLCHPPTPTTFHRPTRAYTPAAVSRATILRRKTIALLTLYDPHH
ncbi:hypothetical protein GLOTRDRAFT_101379 [Gloeophyllum trabeum ATCC 11539]|uniref:Uncharacterized protein n=1 Tax=Gloeophyllum trabeum (strain ATCC 11539 / FP-39264 / Madison 617) TaxID=670483 RepID=S7RH81_GLOTA|nr:uncharacterized protein GLOTRDRAFT_101379 [Gloeophyllum trabeum ATCC 11539]EPQ51934.1 hypothetical protein GLOTRDRAFT_101379 [Gloeophyllum trabeum ATCC 11539]